MRLDSPRRGGTMFWILSALCSGICATVLWADVNADGMQPIPPGDFRLEGYLGERIDANRHGILMDKDEAALLAPFRDRGNKDQSWIGEHVGKWLSAAAIACRHAPDDDALRAKLIRVADGLIATQEDDGYLGTYIKSDRWTSWDVWVLKYNLIGLIEAYDTTGDARYLQACRGIGDLMSDTFGPDKRDILKAGTHRGMAPASILQPIVWLYQRTNEPRYRDFAAYLVEALARDGGPKIVPDLMKGTPIHKVANAKAYEMLSDILGLLEAHREGLCPDAVKASKKAAADILANRLYITGGSTYGEFFQETGHLPNVGHVGETCVTMSQLQFYNELLRQTGDITYAHAAEHLIHNHLLACQHADGKSICYYTPLRGHKFYFTFLGCCISSGPRALAMMPETAYLQQPDVLIVNHLGAATLDTTLDSGQRVILKQSSDYPWDGIVKFDVSMEGDTPVTMKIRIPSFAGSGIKLNEHAANVSEDELNAETIALLINTLPTGQGWWQDITIDASKRQFELEMDLSWELIEGEGQNEGYVALQRGPVVFAYDLHANRAITNALYASFPSALDDLAPKLIRRDDHVFVEVSGLTPEGDAIPPGTDDPLSAPPVSWKKQRLKLLPYAAAGEKDYFTVWLPIRSDAVNPQRSLFSNAHQKLSRQGRHDGSLVDNDPTTFASTDNGQSAEKDFFEVGCGWHTKYNVIVFRHGRTFPGGGWFDTSKGKPEILAGSYGRYYSIGTLDDYPDTTATDPGKLEDGQPFRFIIPKDHRESEHAIRIQGVPAHGEAPDQSFSTCANIEIYYDPELE